MDRSRRWTDCRGWIPSRNDRDALTGFRRRNGLESTGQERHPRRRPRKAALFSGLVQSRLLSCPRHRSEASGQAGDVARQVNNLTRRVDDLAGCGRKGLRGRRTGSRPKSICGKSVANRLRVDPPSLSDLPEHVYLQHVFAEPPRGFEPRTYALRVGGRHARWSFREASRSVSCRLFTVAAVERGRVRRRVRRRVGALANRVAL